MMASTLFGGIVGTCELIGRYRDAPAEALRHPASRGYFGVNAANVVGFGAMAISGIIVALLAGVLWRLLAH
jgi:hypothetical protein